MLAWFVKYMNNKARAMAVEAAIQHGKPRFRYGKPRFKVKRTHG